MDSPRSVSVVGEERLRERSPTSILDVLNDQPGVWVEKRNSTDTNLILRGFGGAFNLALVDGDSLTTLWGEGGEGGDDMYGKVEPDSIRRIEVIRGPSSVLYGSNALGGVVNFIPRKCPLGYAEKGGMEIGGRIKASHETASEAYHGRGEVYLSTSRLRGFLGGGARNVSDTRAGGGKDLSPTGGEDRHLDTALEFKLADEHTLELTYQRMDRDHIFRYYRPAQLNSNNRDAGHLLYRWRPVHGSLREFQAKQYVQRKKDRRIWKDTGERGRAAWFSLEQSGQVEIALGARDEHRLIGGVSHHVDFGESADDEQFTLRVPNGPRRKDAPDTVWRNDASFGLYEWAPFEGLLLSLSGRVDYFEFFSRVDRYYAPPSASQDPKIDELSAYKHAFSGGAGLVYRILNDPDVRVFANYARGIRLNPPVFGLTQHGQGIRAPSGMLEPVTGDSLELGLRNAGRHFQGSLAVYASRFQHFQAMAPGSYGGQDWFDFNGDGARQPDESILVTTDSGKARLWGIECSQEARIDRLLRAPGCLWVGGGFAYNFGEDETGDPLRFTHPMWGLAKLRWEQGDLWKNSPVKGLYIEYQARIVGRFDRIPRGYLTSDRGYRVEPQDMNSPLLRSYGLPGYTVHDVRLGLQVGGNTRLSLNLENLWDKKHRQAHSRWDETGRNLLMALEFSW